MDWPAIPEDICNELLEYAKTAENVWEAKDTYADFEQYAGPESLKQWVYDNLPKGLSGYMIRLQGMPKSTSIVKHKDGLRRSSYNFVLTENSGITNWYDDNDTLVKTVDYKPKVWYHHQSQVTHDVTQINIPRVAVTIYKFEMQPWLLKEMSR
jgi:hypothetical protein